MSAFLPNRLNLGGADLAVPAYQRHTKSNGRGRHDSIRKIRHFVAANELKGVGHSTVKRRQSAGRCRIIESTHETRHVNSTRQTDRRDMNRFPAGSCLIERRCGFDRKAGITLQVPNDGVCVHNDCGNQISFLGKFFHISR